MARSNKGVSNLKEVNESEVNFGSPQINGVSHLASNSIVKSKYSCFGFKANASANAKGIISD
jgi:hypothetical protein